MPLQKRYFVHTFGCQMNVSDSLRIGEVLGRLHYVPTTAFQEADLIIVNTCAIREKAEEKMLSALGRYRTVKMSRDRKSTRLTSSTQITSLAASCLKKKNHQTTKPL